MVLADLNSGGTQRVVSNLANYWSGTGKKVTVITLSDQQTDFFKLSPAVMRISIGGQENSFSILSGLAANFRRIKLLRVTLKKLKAESAIGLIGQTNILLTLAGLGLETKIIISERNDPRRQSLGRLWNFLRRNIYPLADLVTANSQEIVKALEAFVPKHKLAYLPNPVVFSGPADTGLSQQNRIIAVGRLHHQKAHDILISAFARITPLHPDWSLEIVGDGDQHNALHNQISELGLEDRIALTGRVENVQARLAEAKIFALPSRFEGTPNALLEALAEGLPAIVSDASAGALEFVKHRQNGLVVPVDDISALSQALILMIEDESLRQAYGESSRLMVEQMSLPKVAAEWEKVLQLS
jgi:GalNAc-alpha-(1->4)-GalNAc-alpha-(1->3)-diNAcBac-PP-undecaprenol alpha-1,4-N-acetyl-D-galactosaminyltransferase